MITSIIITSVARAPFMGTVNTEWVRTLEDGSTMTVQNHRLVVRDSAGRIYQEHRTLVPVGQEPQVLRIEISDPEKHTKYFCHPERRSCELRDYAGIGVGENEPAPSNTGNRSFAREDLGKNTIEGLETVGTRETTTIGAGLRGNDHALSSTKDFWYSPQLGINLVVKREDPQHGTVTLSMTNIGLAEPDPKSFSVPAGYTVIDMRTRSAGESTSSVRSPRTSN